eukprot:m.56295 g.56295  ORF g.56295 m.56295 type:complete len:73 (+) comp34585_c0_seq2:944-1162(+)
MGSSQDRFRSISDLRSLRSNAMNTISYFYNISRGRASCHDGGTVPSSLVLASVLGASARLILRTGPAFADAA